MVFLHKMQEHTGIQRPAARAHHQTVNGGESHRARDTSAIPDGAQAGAVAQVRHDDARLRDVGSLRAQLGDQVFV